MSKKKKFFNLYADRSVLLMGLTFFVSGIPLFLTASTLALWLNEVGITNTKVGMLAWVAFPYSIKFLWSPIIDRVKLPYLTARLGRRRSWLLLSQIMLLCSIIGLAQTNPASNLFLTALFAICVSFSSATQDIVMLAYQVERLNKKQYGAGEAMGIFGYRLGMLASGAGALYLSDFMSWNMVYMCLSSFIALGVITTLYMKEPEPVVSEESLRKEKLAHDYLHAHPHIPRPVAEVCSWLYGAVVCPFVEFMTKKGWLTAIFIMLFYKLGDNLIGNFSNIFFMELGFSKAEIASVSKIFGMATTILGGFIGGYMIVRLGVLKSLFIGALIHGLSMLCFIVQAKVGYNLELLYASIALEHITGGMRTTAFLVYQMTLVNPVYAATQLSLLTSATHFGRVITASCSGWLIDHLGWVKFFSLSAASTIVSLLLVVLFITLTQDHKMIKDRVTAPI
jgi:Arabinose efflux permease